VEAVKAWLIAICYIVLSPTARSSVQVTKVVPHECTQFVRIAVMLDGKPVSSASVSVRRGFAPDEKASSFMSTNDDGIASLPKLAPGDYRVDVSFNGIRSAIFNEPVTTDLFLHVAARSDLSTASIDLAKPARELWRADEEFYKQLYAVAYLPAHDRIRTFQETIVDPTGAKVSSAKTWIVQMGTQAWEVVFQGTSDANGQLAGHLREGRYIAICSMPGFRTAIASFEVKNDGSGELRIVLQIAPASE
jgi:hypothetical protein